MENIPTMLLIEAAENKKQKRYKMRIVELVESQKSAPLDPSSVRLITSIVPLTPNVLTHAQEGGFPGSRELHSLPPSIPDCYNDLSKYD